MGTNKQNAMVNSSINLVKSMYQGIASKFNVTLNQAINTAQKAIGNKSNALEATTGISNGYITYSIVLGTPDMKFYNGYCIFWKRKSIVFPSVVNDSRHDGDASRNE